MSGSEDFARVGDLLGGACEAAASATPLPEGKDVERRQGETRQKEGPREVLPTGDVGRSIALAWPEVVGEEVAANATPVHWRSGRLVVSTSSSVWAHTLQYLSHDLCDRLNERLGGGLVEQIAFRHAGWEEVRTRHPARPAGRDGAAGNGPRAFSGEEEDALASVNALDLPAEVRESIARAMKNSFVRGQRRSVR